MMTHRSQELKTWRLERLVLQMTTTLKNRPNKTNQRQAQIDLKVEKQPIGKLKSDKKLSLIS